MINAETLTQSILMALMDEHSRDIDKGRVDIYGYKRFPGDVETIRVSAWETSDPDEIPRRFTIRVIEEAPEEVENA